jgi:fucose 4-O-acetylase-like acetyltransferase
MAVKSSYIDNSKGALIFLVVFCHFIADSLPYSSVLNAAYILIYTFHIPLFVFFSGFLSKDGEKHRDTAVVRFLALYLFCTVGFTFFSDLLYSLTMLAQGFTPGLLWDRLALTVKDTLFSVFTATGPSWYLLSLLFWRLLTPYLKAKRLIFISLVLALVVGGIPQAGPVMSLSRTIVFFPFYLLGYHFDRTLFDGLAQKINAVVKMIAAGILLVILILIQQDIIRLPYGILYAFSCYQDCGYSFAGGVMARGLVFLLAVVISLCFLCLIPKKETFLAKWGGASLGIYILHMFLIPVVAISGTLLQLRLWFIPVVLCTSIAVCVLFASPPCGRLIEGIRHHMNRLLLGVKIPIKK